MCLRRQDHRGKTELTRGKRKSGNSVKQGYQDVRSLLSGEGVHKPKEKRKRFDREVLEEMVKFILSEKNIGALSWGTKEVKLDNIEIIVVPKFIRRRQRNYIYKEYFKLCTDELDTNGEVVRAAKLAGPLGRSMFYEVIKLITSGEERLFTAVEYCTGILVNDPTQLLQRIIDDFTKDMVLHKKLTDHLELAKNFLKNQYLEHLKTVDGVPTHGLEYALDRCSSQDDRTAKCNACLWRIIVGPRNLSRKKRSLRIVEHEGSENDRRIDVVAEAVRMCNHFVNDSRT